MRKLLPIVLCMAGLMSVAAFASEISNPYKEKTLANGLQVYVIENHGVPLATIDITARNGSFTEPQNYAGLSHLYEHMFYKANEKYPSQEKFMERIRELGISFNGYTTEEFVTYFFTLPSKNLEDGMSFMSAAVMTPKFDEKELEREREVVLGEFDRDEAQPTFKLEYAMDSVEWGANVVRKQALGQRPTIKAATRDQMVTIEHRFYIPNNCALIISGDVDADKVFAYAEKYLGSWKRGDDPFPKYDPPIFQPFETKLIEREAALPNVIIGQRYWGPSVHWGGLVNDDEGVYIADLLTTILSDETSEFHHVLVDSGIAISAGAGYNMQHNVGPLEFDLEMKPENTKKAIAVLHDQIRKMTSPEYYTEDELAAAKQTIITNRLYDMENPMNFAIATTASWWGIAGIPFYLNYLDKIKKVTRQDLADFAKQYLTKPYILGVGANAETLKQLALDPKEALQ